VRYDELIEATRAQVERNHRRPLAERAFRRALLTLVTHPAGLRLLAPLAGRVRLPGSGRCAALTRLAPKISLRRAWARLPALSAARAERRGRAALLQGCVQRVFFPEVNRATVEVLTAEGFEVRAPSAPRCCGALALHCGYEDEARARARATIESLEDADVVVVNAAGCGSAVKGYGRLLADEPAWAERAATFAAKVQDVTELLAGLEARTRPQPLRLRAAYHDPCHLAHAQGIRAEPRAVLARIPGLELIEVDGWEVCCGSAGIYNLLEVEAAAELGRRKAQALIATGAEAVIAANPGCALQIAAHLGALGHPLPVHHPVTVLAAALTGSGLPGSASPGRPRPSRRRRAPSSRSARSA
jgi:glycolate oxidase iron-sulfur subunit